MIVPDWVTYQLKILLRMYFTFIRMFPGLALLSAPKIKTRTLELPRLRYARK